MTLKNTRETYGLIAVMLHWIIAAGFLGAYMAVYYRHWFSQSEFSMTELNSNVVSLYLHLSFGLTVFAFVLLRVFWACINPKPDDISGGSRLEHLAARGMHYLLYAVMIMMPLTGYMGTRLDTQFFLLFAIPKFNDTLFYPLIVEQLLQTDWEQFEPVVDAIHKNGGAFLVWLLILLHAGAGFYHHTIRKNRVLKRMAPWVEQRGVEQRG